MRGSSSGKASLPINEGVAEKKRKVQGYRKSREDLSQPSRLSIVHCCEFLFSYKNQKEIKDNKKKGRKNSIKIKEQAVCIRSLPDCKCIQIPAPDPAKWCGVYWGKQDEKSKTELERVCNGRSSMFPGEE